MESDTVCLLLECVCMCVCGRDILAYFLVDKSRKNPVNPAKKATKVTAEISLKKKNLGFVLFLV